MNRLDGKIAYITGGSSGIGLAAARLLVEGGARVVLLARDQHRLEAACRELGDAAEGRPLDVTDPGAVTRVIVAAARDLGPPDLLINSAGGAHPGPFSEMSRGRFDATLKVNLYGVRDVIAAALPRMSAGGAIVNISSVAGLIGVYGYTDYCAAKFAVVGFSEALRAELKPRGIQVSVLCPPDTDTPGLAAEDATKPAETRAISKNAGVLSAEVVARDLLDGVRRGRFLIVPGASARFTVVAKRLWPSLVTAVMDHTIAKVRRERPGG